MTLGTGIQQCRGAGFVEEAARACVRLVSNEPISGPLTVIDYFEKLASVLLDLSEA